MIRAVRRFAAGVRTLLARNSQERELDEELQAYLAASTAEKVRLGATPEAAARLARADIGSLAAVKDATRDVGWEYALERLMQDVSYAARALRRSPGFAAAAIFTLALGIGANTAVFSVVNTVLLRPLPYPESERLVRIMTSTGPDGGTNERTPATLDRDELALLQDTARTLSHVVAYPRVPMWLTTASETRQVIGARVSPSVFSMLGAHPYLGRAFHDEAAAAEPIMVLSFAMWQRHFESRPDVIGTTVTLEGTAFTIVGVMPSSFEFPDRQTLFWVPLWTGQLPFQRSSRMTIMARLAPGAPAAAASHEISRILEEYRGNVPQGEYVETERPPFEVVRVHDELIRPVRSALLALAGSVGFVLLIACVNVANLLLARTEARRRELAVRSALGAGRWRLMRQLLAESCLLSLLGGLAGLFAAWLGIRLLKSFGQTLASRDVGTDLTIPRLDDLSIDWTVLTFTLAVAAATSLLCAAGPAITHTALRLVPDLGTSAPSLAARLTPNGQRRLHGILVMVEIAAAVILMTGAALLLRSFLNLSTVNPGYDASDVLTFQVARGRHSEAEHNAFADALAKRLQSVPGIRAVAYSTELPLTSGYGGMPLKISPDASEPLVVTPSSWQVGGDFLAVFRIPLRAGRAFGPEETAGGARPILINETLARQAFGTSRDAVGKRLYMLGGAALEVIGVVGDVRRDSLDQTAGPQTYGRAREGGLPRPLGLGRYFAVRPEAGTELRQADLLAIVRQIDPRGTLENVTMMEDIVANSLVRPRFYTVLFTVFSTIALALAAIGIFGVMAYSVAQRTREFGIRLALGASTREVMRLVLAHSTRLIASGIAIGLIGAAMLTRRLEGLLFGLEPLDLPTFAVVATAFTLIALIAAWLPAHRASGVDPLITLQCE